MKKRPPANFALILLALTGLYFIAGKLGLSLAFLNESASAVWPPTGLALAAVMILGYRVWPAIFVGAFLVNLSTAKHLSSSADCLTSLAIAGGNTLEALVGALLMRSFSRGTAAFERTGDIFRYVFFVVIPSTALSATIGVTALALVHIVNSSSFAPVWFTWWTGDFGSDLLIAPLIILWVAHRRPDFKRNALIEAISLLLASFALSCIVFGGMFLNGRREYPLEYLSIPILIWGAFRFTQLGAVTSAFVISCVAVAATRRGLGPFAVGDLNDSMVLLQMFVGVTTLTVLVLAAGVAEKQQDQAERDALLEREGRARAEAERANRAKDQFLAVLSHELRTPLTPVMLSASLLEDDPEIPERLRGDVEMIRRNVELEARLIDDLLDLTRITRGKLQLEMQTIDLHLLIQRTIDICLRDAPIAVKVHLEAQSHHVRGDPARLQQIFWNLLNNARKFTSAGGTIIIRSKNARSGDEIEVAVSDTGEGIEPEMLPKLFLAFEQGESARSGRNGGLGLGLAISKALVVAHRGALSAQSEGLGRGSSFIVHLPTTAVPQRGASDDAGHSPATASPSRSLRILLVEDHENTLTVMRRLLSTWHHEVTCATSVASAVEAMREDQFDLLISDLGLPDGLGYDIMRAVQGRYGMKGIALSGYGMDADIDKSRQAGFVEHLIKPVSIDALEAAISRATRD